MVLTHILFEKLVELSPGLADEPYDDAVRQITANPSARSRSRAAGWV